MYTRHLQISAFKKEHSIIPMFFPHKNGHVATIGYQFSTTYQTGRMALHFKGIPKRSVGQTQSCEIVHTLSKYYAATLPVCHFKSLGSLSRVCCHQPLAIKISL
jgi:hypothetical protein